MASSLQEYLKRYTSDADTTAKSKKKKKKKQRPSKPVSSSIRLVDADPVWQKELKEESSESEEEQDDAPLVIKDVEVKRMQRMEALKMHRPYISTADDGSGWVSVNTTTEQDFSAPRQPHSGETSPHDLGNHDSEHGGMDLSPPRRRVSSTHNDSHDLSPPRRKGSNLDLSPPRSHRTSGQRFEGSSARTKVQSPDLSPPRKKIQHPRIDSSPPRKADSPDLSPPRKKIQHPRIDSSPPRKADSPDLSPPRKRTSASRIDNSSLSPPRRKTTTDLSPPRKKHTSSDKISSPLRRTRSPDLSPPRKRVLASRMGSPSLSPPRRKITAHKTLKDASDDLSPPRKASRLDLSPQRKGHISSETRLGDSQIVGKTVNHDLSPPRKSRHDSRKDIMADGTAAGLRTGGQLAREIEIKKQEESRRFKEIDASITGRRANTVYRDKHGRRLESVEELQKLQQEEKAPKEEKPLEWGKGLAQKREAEIRNSEIEAEKSKPFARTRDDPDLDKHLKEQVRWGDPMAHLVKKKSTSEHGLVDLGASEKMKESGFIVPQSVPSHSWLKRGITPPPNRYNIRPGRHWDGVDRSTGFERDMYKRLNERKANEVEAYMWSVADM